MVDKIKTEGKVYSRRIQNLLDCLEYCKESYGNIEIRFMLEKQDEEDCANLVFYNYVQRKNKDDLIIISNHIS